jgi:hypothetical protein
MFPTQACVVSIPNHQLIKFELVYARASIRHAEQHGDFYCGGEDEVNRTSKFSIVLDQFISGG